MSFLPVTERVTNALWDRRGFVVALTKILGASTLLIAPGFSVKEEPTPIQPALTVRQVIDLILKTIPDAPFKETLDTLKAGNPNQKVTGIVTTTFATLEVIEKAISLGANFIIAHEPTYYNHLDETTWLKQDQVYGYKHDLLRKHNLAVWRFHDYWHAHSPDGIQMGALTTLGWEKYIDRKNPYMLTLPATTLEEIVRYVKAIFAIPMLRIIGELSHTCQRVALLPGAVGGRSQIAALQKEKPDLLICGELSEWETSEYIRDARYMGTKLALIVLGHAVSEEPGMQWLVSWLKPKLSNIRINHIPAQNPFTWM